MAFKVLDLYCCDGGATAGYKRAWPDCHVTGVDIEPHPQYCGDEFIQASAIAYALEHAHEYDFIHGSPPCQFGSSITPDASLHLNLVSPTRRALLKSRRPYVIENVPPMEGRAPMRRDLILCGEMFGLRVVRHRIFEVGGWLPRQLRHVEHQGPTIGAGRSSRGTYSPEGYYYAAYGTGGPTGKGTTEQWGAAMDIDWITDRQNMAEAIPPAYTQYIANEFSGVTSAPEVIRNGYR